MKPKTEKVILRERAKEFLKDNNLLYSKTVLEMVGFNINKEMINNIALFAESMKKEWCQQQKEWCVNHILSQEIDWSNPSKVDPLVIKGLILESPEPKEGWLSAKELRNLLKNNPKFKELYENAREYFTGIANRVAHITIKKTK